MTPDPTQMTFRAFDVTARRTDEQNEQAARIAGYVLAAFGPPVLCYVGLERFRETIVSTFGSAVPVNVRPQSGERALWFGYALGPEDL